MKPLAYSKYAICRHLLIQFLSRKVGGSEKSLIAVIFNCALEYATRKVQADQEGLKMLHISFWSMQMR
jgi:hypothetical protein